MPTQIGVLAVLGLGTDAEVAYRALLREPARREDGSPLVGWPAQRLASALDELRRAGLVQAGEDTGREPTLLVQGRSPAAAVTVREPAVAAGSLLRQAEGEVEVRLRRLGEARTVIDQMEADYVRARAEVLGTPMVDLVEADVAPAAVISLIRTGTGSLSVMHSCPSSGGTADRALFEVLGEAVAAGRGLRAIYPSAVLEDERWAAWARRRAAMGEEQRLSVVPVPALKVMEGEAVVVGEAAPGPADRYPGSGVLLLRTSLLVRTFTEIFEGWWHGCVAMPGDEVGDARGRLLGLLAAGCKDETVARLLGTSVRTVRRRVSELMEETGAATRFQLGVEVARRSLT
jgi:hypothetical protein